jgi:hypothetical protein
VELMSTVIDGERIASGYALAEPADEGHVPFAMAGRVLGAASIAGTYATNPKLL